jgi:TRAP-type uncharacterized transport system substrate-binding protein
MRPGGASMPGRQRAVLAAVTVLALVVAVLVAFVHPSEQSEQGASAAEDGLPPLATDGGPSCERVKIFAGAVALDDNGRPESDDPRNSPYTRYARVLEQRLEAAGEGWDVEVLSSAGSAQSLENLRAEQRPRCTLALAQLGTAVDAKVGVNQFAGNPVLGLRTIGPTHDNILHMIVNADGYRGGPVITSPEQLCGLPVAVGQRDSGTTQVVQVLLRVALGPSGCDPMAAGAGSAGVDRSRLGDALAKLAHGEVAAVFWTGAAGTSEIVAAIDGGVPLRLIDLTPYRDRMQDDFDNFYRSRLREAFFPSNTYPLDEVRLNDYPDVPATPAIVIPNAVLAHESADPALVRRVSMEIFRDQSDYVDALWPGNPADRRLPDELSVYENSLFCFVPLHDEAAVYYSYVEGRAPACGRNQP